MEDSKQPVPGLHISGAIEGYVAAVNPHPAADSSSGQLVSSHADHLPDRWASMPVLKVTTSPIPLVSSAQRPAGLPLTARAADRSHFELTIIEAHGQIVIVNRLRRVFIVVGRV